MDFFYVYKSLAHPGKDGYVQPFTLKERLAQVAEAKRQYDTQIPWICDSMENEFKHAFGDRNNSEFVIDPDGKFVRVRDWSKPDELRADLEKLVGKAKTFTRVNDLDRNTSRPDRSKYPRGIVPKLQVPEGLTPVRLKPLLDQGSKPEPFYVKLRAEASRALLSGGQGQIHLAFNIDPLHKIHWNNLAPPLKYTITSPKGIKVTPETGEGPKVKEEADVDPREFLVDVDLNGSRSKEPLKLRVDYFPCHDEEGWCRAVSQEYEIFLETDRDAGRVQNRGSGGRGRGRGRGRPPGGGGFPRPPGTPSQMADRMMQMDLNGDKKISRSEARGPLLERFNQMDLNRDGFITADEIEQRFERFQGRGRRRF